MTKTKYPFRISVFFPAYNEEDNIVASVREAVRVLSRLTPAFEVIVINDGSRDKTGQFAENLAMEDHRVKVINHPFNKGYGAALWTGIQAASYEWVFFTDADLQFDLSEIERLIDHIPEYEVVLGYRAPRRDPFMRLVNAKGWNILNRLLFELKVRDIDCAFKLFRKELVVNLPIKSRGAMMSAEMLIRLQRNGVRFKEVPVTHLPRVKGSPTGAKPSVIMKAFLELYSLFRGDLGKVKSTYVQAALYAVIGVINTVTDIASYYGMTRLLLFFSTHIVFAKFLSFFLGTIVSYTLNRKYTFDIKEGVTFKELARFYSSVAVTMTVNVSTLYILTSFLHFNDMLAVAMATLASFSIGFVLSKIWVFKDEKVHSEKKPFHIKDAVRNAKKLDWEEIARSSNDL